MRTRLLFSQETAAAAAELVRVVAQAAHDRGNLPTEQHRDADPEIKAARIQVEAMFRTEINRRSWWRRIWMRARRQPAD